VMNVSQLYVQSSAMLTALTMGPIRDIPNIVEKMAIFALLDNVKDETALGGVIKLLLGDDNLGKLLAEELEAYTAWRRSGLLESVRGNADMNHAAATGLGITADWLRKAGNLSLAVYRPAELINRRVSFLAAFRQQKAATPNAVVNDDFLNDTLRTANEYMWELDTANKSWWQGGNGANAMQKATALFGQFSQVTTRTMEYAFKGQQHGGWTPRRKARWAAGQILLFGAAAVPGISMFGPWIAQQMTEQLGLDPNEDSETIESIANFYNQGISGVTAWEMMGAKVDVASRASLGGSVLPFLTDVFTSKDPFWIKMLGLTGDTGRRVGDVLSTSKLETQSIVRSHTLEAMAQLEPLMLGDRTGAMDITPADYTAALKDLFIAGTGLTATTRNLLKGHLMQHSGIILDRRGRVLVEADFNWQTELAVAMGFRASAESRVRSVERDNRYWDEVIHEMSDTIISAYHRYVFIHESKPEYANKLRLNIQVLQESLGNPNLQEKLRSSLESRMFTKPSTIEDRAIADYIKNVGMDNVTRAMIMDSQNVINVKTLFEDSPVTLPLVGLGRDKQTLKTELSTDEGEE
jgi:hypothetical protein